LTVIVAELVLEKRYSLALAEPGLSTTVPLRVRAAPAPASEALGSQTRLETEAEPANAFAPERVVTPAPVIFVPGPSVLADKPKVAPESRVTVPIELKAELLTWSAAPDATLMVPSLVSVVL